jgi:hypothetical protein
MSAPQLLVKRLGSWSNSSWFLTGGLGNFGGSSPTQLEHVILMFWGYLNQHTPQQVKDAVNAIYPYTVSDELVAAEYITLATGVRPTLAQAAAQLDGLRFASLAEIQAAIDFYLPVP